MRVRNESRRPVRVEDAILIPGQTREVDNEVWEKWLGRSSGNRAKVAQGKLRVIGAGEGETESEGGEKPAKRRTPRKPRARGQRPPKPPIEDGLLA